MNHTEEALIPADRASAASAFHLRRLGVLVYGVGAYALGVTALVGLILASLGELVFTGGPLRIHGAAGAALFDLGLLSAFGLQHSVMARESFKARLERVMPRAVERSTFVLATGVVLIPLLALWQPLPTVLWSASTPLARSAIVSVNLLGWTYLLAATFAINHFELFGLEQSWRAARGELFVPARFSERWMYRFDRHPIMTGVLVGLWATPRMTVGYFLLAAGLTAYVVIGVHFEERALHRQWGTTYDDYRRRVPSIVPTWRRRQPSAGGAERAGQPAPGAGTTYRSVG